MSSLFERFTERARQVVVLAQEEARDLNHPFIGTEHILLGLLREEEGLAARVLEGMGVTTEIARHEVELICGKSETEPESGQLPFTPRAKKVLELGLREALSLGHNYIGTEHILLGLARENEGIANQILEGFDADGERIRNEVIRLLSGPGAKLRKAEEKDPPAKLAVPRPGGREAYDLWCTGLLAAMEGRPVTSAPTAWTFVPHEEKAAWEAVATKMKWERSWFVAEA